MSQFYFVKWKQGEIRIHASSEEEAIRNALKYIAQPERKLISAHPLPKIEDKDAKLKIDRAER